MVEGLQYLLTKESIIYLIIAYIIGSIPVGTIFAFLCNKQSLFPPNSWSPYKSGEIFKILGFKLALLVTLIDFIKGFITVAIIPNYVLQNIKPDYRIIGLAGILVVVGHCYSIWLGFRGGRGLATIFGVLFYILPIPAVIIFVLWGILAFWGLSARAGALSAAGAMPIVSLIYIWFFASEKLDLSVIVAIFSVITLWEYRNALYAYMGISSNFEINSSDLENINK